MRGREGKRHRRRERSVFYLVGLALSFVSSVRAQESTESPADRIPLAVVPGFTAVRIASGLTRPIFVTAPPGDVNHIYIVEQTGQILSLDLSTNSLSTFFTLQGLTSTSGEQGLLGMAFDPNYASNGKFYLDFTVPGGAFGNGVTHVSQFQLPAVKKKKKKKKRSSTEVVLLTYVHPQTNHNGGWIGFSPRTGDDNNLYIASGDGGGGNDQGVGHLEPGGNAQSNTTLLGKTRVSL